MKKEYMDSVCALETLIDDWGLLCCKNAVTTRDLLDAGKDQLTGALLINRRDHRSLAGGEYDAHVIKWIMNLSLKKDEKLLKLFTLSLRATTTDLLNLLES